MEKNMTRVIERNNSSLEVVEITRACETSSCYFIEGKVLREYIERYYTPPRLLIPRTYLYGIQTKEEYDECKRNSVEKDLIKQGINYLINEPILACGVTGRQTTQLFIVDGHHRARYSGRFKIHSLPCLIATPTQLVDAIGQCGGINLSEAALVENLVRASTETLSSFKNLSADKQPRSIPNIIDVSSLSNQFATF